MGQHSKYSFEMKLAAVTKYLEGSCSTESIARSMGTNGTRIVEWVTLYYVYLSKMRTRKKVGFWVTGR